MHATHSPGTGEEALKLLEGHALVGGVLHVDLSDELQVRGPAPGQAAEKGVWAGVRVWDGSWISSKPPEKKLTTGTGSAPEAFY